MATVLHPSRLTDGFRRPGKTSRRNGSIGLRTLLAAVLGAAWLLRAAAALSQPSTIDPKQEYNVKAVYLYSFGRYVAWPDSTEEKFVIGMLESDPFGGAMNQIAQHKRIQGKAIELVHFSSMDEYRPCSILFIPRSASPEQQALAMSRLRGMPVLLVGESDGFASAGGTIGFFLVQDSVHFEINVEAAQQQGLTVDAKLLSLARVIRGSR